MTMHGVMSPGQLADQIGIVAIKLERGADPEERERLKRDRDELAKAWRDLVSGRKNLMKVFDLIAQLRKSNERIWDIRQAIVDLEDRSEFDDEFLRLEREEDQERARRAQVKHEINLAMGHAPHANSRS